MGATVLFRAERPVWRSVRGFLEELARPDEDDGLIAEAWCKALQGFSWYSNPPRDQRRLSEEAPLEDTGRPKLFMVILQFDATCSALCKATE